MLSEDGVMNKKIFITILLLIALVVTLALTGCDLLEKLPDTPELSDEEIEQQLLAKFSEFIEDIETETKYRLVVEIGEDAEKHITEISVEEDKLHINQSENSDIYAITNGKYIFSNDKLVYTGKELEGIQNIVGYLFPDIADYIPDIFDAISKAVLNDTEFEFESDTVKNGKIHLNASESEITFQLQTDKPVQVKLTLSEMGTNLQTVPDEILMSFEALDEYEYIYRQMEYVLYSSNATVDILFNDNDNNTMFTTNVILSNGEMELSTGSYRKSAVLKHEDYWISITDYATISVDRGPENGADVSYVLTTNVNFLTYVKGDFIYDPETKSATATAQAIAERYNMCENIEIDFSQEGHYIINLTVLDQYTYEMMGAKKLIIDIYDVDRQKQLSVNEKYADVTEKIKDDIYYKILSQNTLIVNTYLGNEVDVVIPESVTIYGKEYAVEVVDSYAFSHARLSSLTLPKSIKTIYAYYAYKGIDNLIYQGTLADWCGITHSSYRTPILDNVNNLYIDGQLISTELVIPDGVTQINNVFAGYKSIVSVVIPKSVQSINEDAFYGCPITTIMYEGAQEEWNNSALADNNFAANATVYFYSETQPESEGYFWHYVDGKVTVW